MGRLEKDLAVLPTLKLRARLWARYVRHELIPDEVITKPLARRINDAIRNKAEKNRNAKKMSDDILKDGNNIVSGGRWMDWWNGTCPTQKKLELINWAVSGSKAWFESQESKYLSPVNWKDGVPDNDKGLVHPIHTLLYAIDQWSPKNRANSNGLLLVKKIADLWRPRFNIGLRDSQLTIERSVEDTFIYNRWYVWPARCVISGNNTERFRLLEPSSIVTFMLWFGYTYSINTIDRNLFVTWVFDLLSASMATSVLINDFGDQNGFKLAGESGDSAALVRWLLLWDWGHTDSSKALGIIKAQVEGYISFDSGFLPTDSNFFELLLQSRLLFESEMEKFGVTVSDIKNIWTQQITGALQPDKND